MRVEAYSQVHQLYQTNKVNKTRQSGNMPQKDQLQFSNLGRDIGAAQAAIAASPDVREELVSSIRAKVQNGTYSVDNESFADKLISKFNEVI